MLLQQVIIGVILFLCLTAFARGLGGFSKTGREGLFIIGALIALVYFSPLTCVAYIFTPAVLSLGLRVAGR